MGANFLNIELEVRSTEELASLSKALGENFVANYCDKNESGQYFLSGSHVDGGLEQSTPEGTASDLCGLVDNLSDAEKVIWDNAEDRVFDVGLEANEDPKVVLNLFTSETGERIARLNARIAVSVYTTEMQETLRKNVNTKDNT